MRRGRFEDPVGIKDLESCPSDCYQRSNCSQCIGEPGRCVWCQERQECFQFSVYIAEYQYGQCKAWIDKGQIISEGNFGVFKSPKNI